MSPFNQQILAAKKKQRLLYSKVFALFLIGVLVVAAAILVSRGSRIEVHPNDAAELSSVQLHKGIAIVIGDTLYSVSKKPAISVSADGFKPKIQVLNSSDFGHVVSVTLEPLPAKLKLSTNTNADKTSWLINDKTVAIASVFEHSLGAGDYKLTVRHPYYNDASLALSLTRGEFLKLAIPLTPIEGRVVIKSVPAGAHLAIDGIGKGILPLNIPLHGGVHQVKVTLNNYQTINDNIEISRSQSIVNRNYKLQLTKSAIAVSLEPEGGQLILDNIIVHNAKKIPVSKGVNHVLSYAKQGYFTQNKTVNLKSDETVNLAFSLKEERGLVEINSSPKADVKLNGKFIGHTPLQLSLRAINQEITLQAPGSRSVIKQIIPSAANTKKISVKLISEKIARLKEATKLYTHQAGGKLKLFKPNDTFIMGAERSERGQRANEFVRKVKLSKAFYAGITEVTNAEYRLYNKNITAAASDPVTNILWIEAAGFCNWLSQLEGLSPVYHISNKQLIGVNAKTDGYRLLTEAEWEWLARKSGKSKQTLYVWGNGNVIPKQTTNIADESAKGSVDIFVSQYNDGYSEVAPVKSFNQEASGLYDQSGNISEWTHDSYSVVRPKAGKVFENPFDQTIKSLHVVKGANWQSGSITELRPSFREGGIKQRNNIGFRIGRYVYGGN